LGLAPAEVTPHFKVREGGETMKALAWFGKKDVRVIDAPIPDITHPDDVIVKVTGNTICGGMNSPWTCLTIFSFAHRLGSPLVPQ